jgi:hypothetical protein
MSQPALEVADILRAFAGHFISRARISWPQNKVMLAIERCRTALLGRHRDRCSDCGKDLGWSFNSCLMGSIFLWGVGPWVSMRRRLFRQVLAYRDSP